MSDVRSTKSAREHCGDLLGILLGTTCTKNLGVFPSAPAGDFEYATDMDAAETDRLVADLCAVTVRVTHLLKTEPSLTALQRDCLLNAIGNLNTFFAIWKTPRPLPPDSRLE